MKLSVPALGSALRSGFTWDRLPDRLTGLVVAVCLGLGLWLRARGFLWKTEGLWLDECIWVINLFERPLIDSLIRPIGFLAISKGLAKLFGPTEAVLRTLPWCAGVLTVLLSPLLAKRLFRAPAARTLFVAIIALHPAAIDFSKEFKPYSLSLAIHLLVVYLALRYTESLRSRDLAWLLFVAGVGILFTQDLVFAYPGLFLVAGWAAYRHHRKQLVAIGGAATAIIVTLLLLYTFVWRRLPATKTEYWGRRYDVFYPQESKTNRFHWWLAKYTDMAAFPGLRRIIWEGNAFAPLSTPELREDDYIVWIVLHGVGIAVMLRRRQSKEGLLLVLPLALLSLFNRVGFWPLGVFRTNLFSVGYLTAIASMAFDGAAERRSRWLSTVPTLLLVLMPLAAFENTWHSRKRVLTHDSSFPNALRRVSFLHDRIGSKGKDVLLLDRRSCAPFRYYTQFQPSLALTLRTRIEKRFETHCVELETGLLDAIRASSVTPERRVWMVLHVPTEFESLLRRRRLREFSVIRRETIVSHTLVGLRRRQPAAPDTSADKPSDTSPDTDAEPQPEPD